MYAGDRCTKKWVQGTLENDDIVNYLKEGLGMDDDYTEEEIQHTADICHSIYLDITRERQDGDFVKNVLDNDLMNAVLRADMTIRRSLNEIVLFLHNAAPMAVPMAIKSDEDTYMEYKNLMGESE